MTTTKIVKCDFSNTRHLQAVALLVNAYISDEMGGGKPLTEREELYLVNGLCSHPKAIVLLAENEGVFVGLLVAFENFSTFTVCPMVNIHDIIVLRKYRKRGIGQQLMNALIVEAENRNCSRVTLEVRNDNIVAQTLYRNLGFEATSPEMLYWRKNIKIQYGKIEQYP